MHVATATQPTANHIAPESSKLCTQILQILTTTSNKLKSVQSVKAAVITAESSLHGGNINNRSNSDTPLSSIASCDSSAGAEVYIETDSGKSSCEPILLDESVDSGIMVEFKDLELQKRIQQCQRILKTLERDQENYRRLRERLSKISDRKNRKSLPLKQEPFCNVCCSELNLNDAKCFVTCGTCKKAICRNISCADWYPKSAQWECQLCYSKKESFSQTSTWVAEQMSFNQQKMIQYPIRARSEIYIPINDFNDSNMHFESVSQVGLSGATISAEQKLKIREYVEELVSNILGGSLDKVAVGQLSRSENYLPGILNGAKPAATGSDQNDFSDISETRLKRLISTIIAETIRLPILNSATSEHNINERKLLPLTNGNTGKYRKQKYFEPETYQELLATAVLNRIIGKENDKRVLSESTPDINRQTLDANFNVDDHSGSSADPISEYSYSDEGQINEETSSKYIRGRESALSDYIASHTVPLPDLSTPNTDEDEHGSVSSSFIGEGTWEDNWLFKRKPLESAIISSGNRMLIPAPKEDVRAKIGDKIADEVSDLSEVGSETEDSSLDVLRKDLNPLNDRLLNKHLIGGENTKMVLDELMDTSLDTKQISIPEPLIEGLENKETVKDANGYPLSDQLSTDSNHTDDSTTSYVDQYSNSDIQSTENNNLLNLSTSHATNQINAQNINNSQITHDVTNLNNSSSPVCLAHNEEITVSAVIDDDDGDKVDLFRRFVPGSIAEREYKKWNNAVEMPNNPYAPEALKRRISGSSTDPLIDLPMISPSTEQNPLAFLKENTCDEDDEKTKMLQREQDKLRYSRDYYINDDGSKKRTSGNHSPQKVLSMENSDEPCIDNVIINEVNPQGSLKSSNIDTQDRKNDWTLSTPVVRRSSSLKFINKRHSSPFSPSISPISRKQEVDNDDDTHSQRSWKSVSVNFGQLSNRNVHSSLSVHSSASGGTSSSASKRRSLSNANILSQFEKQLLHKDLKRNSFRAISQTTKDFVMNPLFESEKFYNLRDANVNAKDQDQQLQFANQCESVKEKSTEDLVDSGIDSCLNGFNEKELNKSNNDHMLF